MTLTRRELELAVAALPEGWKGTLDDAFEHLHLQAGDMATIQDEIDALIQQALDHLGEAMPQHGPRPEDGAAFREGEE